MAASEIAILGGGCFWCIEAVFKMFIGVNSVISGYSGGAIPNPTYEQVSTGKTGHAEVVKIEFDPSKISYQEILEVFFHSHDPTTLNRQGNDTGTQYRSVIFFNSPEQEKTARSVTARIEADKLWNGALVTEILSAAPFYAAEDYHQDYFANNKNQPYCSIVIAPKISKIRKAFKDKLL